MISHSLSRARPASDCVRFPLPFNREFSREPPFISNIVIGLRFGDSCQFLPVKECCF